VSPRNSCSTAGGMRKREGEFSTRLVHYASTKASHHVIAKAVACTRDRFAFVDTAHCLAQGRCDETFVILLSTSSSSSPSPSPDVAIAPPTTTVRGVFRVSLTAAVPGDRAYSGSA